MLTWDHRGGTPVIMGDAHMRPDDARVAAQAVRRSLDQLIDLAAGKPLPGVKHSTLLPADPESLDVCNTSTPKVLLSFQPSRTDCAPKVSSDPPVIAERGIEGDEVRVRQPVHMVKVQCADAHAQPALVGLLHATRALQRRRKDVCAGQELGVRAARLEDHVALAAIGLVGDSMHRFDVGHDAVTGVTSKHVRQLDVGVAGPELSRSVSINCILNCTLARISCGSGMQSRWRSLSRAAI